MLDNENQVVATSLKELLAEATLFGMRLSSNSLSGSLFDEHNQDILESISALSEKVKSHIALLNVDVAEQQVLPLSHEIFRQGEEKGALQ